MGILRESQPAVGEAILEKQIEQLANFSLLVNLLNSLKYLIIFISFLFIIPSINKISTANKNVLSMFGIISFSQIKCFRK